MDKLNGLILQLNVKTGFVISETIDEKVEENMDKLRSERDEQIVNLNQALKADSSSSSPTVLINTTLKAMKDDDIDEKYVKLVALKAYATSIKNTTALGKIDKELGNVFNEYKSEYTNTMSKDAFEKLNKVSDTIPNILSQITGLAIFLSRILKANFQTWSTEINNVDLSNLIDTAEENLTSYISMSNNDGILPYKSIFNKNKKPSEEINNLVLSMAKSTGIKSSDLNTEHQFKYINLMDYVNRGNVSNTYTPNFKYEEEDDDEEEDGDEEEEQPKFKQSLKLKREIRRLAKQLEKASNPKKVESLGVEETKGDDDATTGAGKYYYPKRFL